MKFCVGGSRSQGFPKYLNSVCLLLLVGKCQCQSFQNPSLVNQVSATPCGQLSWTTTLQRNTLKYSWGIDSSQERKQAHELKKNCRDTGRVSLGHPAGQRGVYRPVSQRLWHFCRDTGRVSVGHPAVEGVVRDLCDLFLRAFSSPFLFRNEKKNSPKSSFRLGPLQESIKPRRPVIPKKLDKGERTQVPKRSLKYTRKRGSKRSQKLNFFNFSTSF